MLTLTEWKGGCGKKEGKENLNSSSLEIHHHPNKSKSESEMTIFSEATSPSGPVGPRLTPFLGSNSLRLAVPRVHLWNVENNVFPLAAR